MLINIFSKLSTSCEDWCLVIIGDGELARSIDEKIAELRLTDRVFRIGAVGNISDWYETSDLFALPSKYEGFPNVLLEAMSHGLASVAFDCKTGPKDLINHGVNGLLVADGDEKAFTSALKKMMRNRGIRKSISKKAIDVGERFSMPNVCRHWYELFTELKDKNYKRN